MRNIPLVLRYVIIIALAFGCNLVIASRLVNINVRISQISNEIEVLSSQRTEMEAVVAQRRSSDYILKRAHQLGFTTQSRALYILSSQARE